MRLHFQFSNCVVYMKYLTKIAGSTKWYYIRRIPSDVQHHYPDKKDKRIVKSTGTTDKQAAAKKASQINLELNREWESLRNGGSFSLSSSLDDAKQLLAKYGMPPTKTTQKFSQEFDALIDEIEGSLSPQAQEELYGATHSNEAEDIDLRTYIQPEQMIALDIANGRFVWTASLILPEFLKLKGWSESRKQRNLFGLAFDNLIELLGDRAPNEYTRIDVRELISDMLNKGYKTSTVNRRLGCIRSAFNYIITEYELGYSHPFLKFAIEDLRLDATITQEFTQEQLTSLRQKVEDTNDQISGLIAIMMETGLRVSEACSLRSDDLRINDSGASFFTLHRDPVRRLKTKNSVRFVPLVGVALQYAKKPHGKHLFPKYINDDGTVKNDTASASINKRLKAWMGDNAPTSHSFRHTMATRLRDAGCPKDVRDELGGWATSISDSYGSPSDINMKSEYVEKSLVWENSGWNRPT